ncbi:hypothetical protein HNQ56_000788 [Anaerotaenia torta]|uniref:abortive infection system antitoxin AbiGi family protein n=1 Tax=Anaerotaenia torta TaxID=433293 RepID=UPI003D1A2EE2
MEYISNKLIHFVGRSLPTDKDKFELLIKIIKSGKLFANMQDPDKPVVSMSANYSGERAGELFERIDCVCFCDIPDGALNIHTRKYGKFGIGFNKQYLASKGAHPVMYIPINYDIKEISETDLPKNPIEYFNTLSKQYPSTMQFLTMVNQCYQPFTVPLETFMRSDYAPYVSLMNNDTIKDIHDNKFHQILFGQMMAFTGLLSYIKLFDINLSQDDEKNYYMEREWRILRSVEFSLDNIDVLYLPSKSYEKYFMDEFPDYKGIFYSV